MNTIQSISSPIHAAKQAILLATAVAAVLLLGVEQVHGMSQLDYGDQNADVSTLQTYYAKNPAIYPSGLITGYYGALTRSATEKFQTNQGIVSSGDAASTGYGRVGAQTLARLMSLMGNTVGYQNAGGDENAPLMYPESLSVTDRTATFSWTTNETSRGRVMYGTSWPFLYATAPSVMTGAYGATTVITLSNLTPDTRYYYVRESIDVTGNIMWTTAKSFVTDNN